MIVEDVECVLAVTDTGASERRDGEKEEDEEETKTRATTRAASRLEAEKY